MFETNVKPKPLLIQEKPKEEKQNTEALKGFVLLLTLVTIPFVLGLWIA